jgi:hypothetical protein
LSLRNHKAIFKEAKRKGKAEVNEVSLLRSKARLAQKIKALSNNKSLRKRRKAAREQKIQLPEIVNSAYKSNEHLEGNGASDVELTNVKAMPFNSIVIKENKDD